jgi:NADPH-dependent 2,4-dienoyl-CoA reductase/sulfur reductase-like enzyme
MRVLVVGGGVGGVAAAAAAAGKSGVDVTLVEGSGGLGLNQAMFPYVLTGECPPEKLHLADVSFLSKDLGVEVRLNERVLSVDSQSHTARTGDGRLSFDALVLATGSRYLVDRVKGMSKQGVFLMRSLDDYLALSRSRDTLSHIAIMGSAPLSLIVAQALSRGSNARVFLGARGLRRFSPGVERMVARAASARGVELLDADIDAIVGTGRVEAVIYAGGVRACDGVVVLPGSSPLLPQVDCLVGDHGGVLVDRSMRTSSKDIFAAGDCAELRLGSTSLPSRLHSSSRVMGEVAGLNAAGGTVRANLAGSMALDLFGVEVCTAGIEVEEGVRAGLDVARADSEGEMRDGLFGGGDVCTSIVYGRSTRRVHGIQVAGPGALSLSEYASLAVSSGAVLEDLAYHESPYLPNFNKDKSPISLTAGKALSHVQDQSIEAQGTHLRHR